MSIRFVGLMVVAGPSYGVFLMQLGGMPTDPWAIVGLVAVVTVLFFVAQVAGAVTVRWLFDDLAQAEAMSAMVAEATTNLAAFGVMSERMLSAEEHIKHLEETVERLSA